MIMFPLMWALMFSEPNLLPKCHNLGQPAISWRMLYFAKIVTESHFKIKILTPYPLLTQKQATQHFHFFVDFYWIWPDPLTNIRRKIMERASHMRYSQGTSQAGILYEHKRRIFHCPKLTERVKGQWSRRWGKFEDKVDNRRWWKGRVIRWHNLKKYFHACKYVFAYIEEY